MPTPPPTPAAVQAAILRIIDDRPHGQILVGWADGEIAAARTCDHSGSPLWHPWLRAVGRFDPRAPRRAQYERLARALATCTEVAR